MSAQTAPPPTRTPDTEAAGPQRRQNVLLRHNLPYLFLLPTFLLLIGFMVIPLGYSIVMSFHDWNGITTPVFTGLENYERLLADGRFWAALANNGIFLVLFTSLTVGLGFLFAVAVSRRMKGWRAYRFTFFIPFLLVTAVIAVLWSQIYEPTHGVLNTVLRSVGLGRLEQLWLGNPDLTMYSIIAIAVWQLTGWTMILYLAAMEGIDEDVHDAATIDGVNAWQRCRYIIAPMVKRMTMVLIMLQLIASIKTFDLIWVLTKGGPFYASEVMGTLLYRTAFEQQQFGYASTVAVAMTLVVMALTLAHLRISNLADRE